MSESFIEPESLNSTLVSLDAILDDDGAVRLLNKELSSYNFDGVIPTTASTILVSQLEVGMSFLPIGETEGALRTVVKLEFDDPQMTDTVSNDYIISYLSPSGDIQSVTYDGSQNIEVYFEDWDDKVLGTKGWLITQEGNAIFSNVAVRGRIEATEGLIDGDLIVTGSLSTSETADTAGGIVFDSDGIFAYNTSGTQTFSLDSATGDVTIFGTPGNDLLIGSDLSDTGTTVISANRITTGSVTGRVFRSNSSMTPTSGTGIYLDGNNNVRFSDPDATFTFNSSGLNITNGSNATLTFNSTGLSITGAGVTIGGINPDDFLVPGDVGSSGTTSISGNRITTGVIDSAGYGGVTDGSVFAPGGMAINLDNGTITAKEFRIDTAGNAYFNGDLSSGLSISAPTIIGGLVQSSDFNGTANGANFSSDGTAINLTDGSITSREFRIDSNGDAEFRGNLVAAGGTFSGTLSANSITSGTLSADYISGGTLDASEITVTNLSANSITTGTFSGDRISGGTIDATIFQTNSNNGSNRVELGSLGGYGVDSIKFYSGGAVSHGIYDVGGTLNIGKPSSNASLGVLGNLSCSTFSVEGTVNLVSNAFSGGSISLGWAGPTNRAIRIDSSGNVFSYGIDNTSTTNAANVRVGANAQLLKSSSTIRVKDELIPFGEDLKGVSQDKIANFPASINPFDVISITPTEFKSLCESDNSSRFFGFIAEDVAEKFPWACEWDDEGMPQSVSDRPIIAAMLLVVRDQQKTINSLKERLERLENNG